MKNVLRLLPLLILLTQPALGNTVYEFDVDDQSGSEQTSTVTAFVADGNLKLEINDERKNDHSEMIFHAARKEMVVVNHDDKSYMVLDQETLEAIGGQIDSAMREVKEALAEVPEDQRAMVEKMMQEQLGALMEVTKTKVPASRSRRRRFAASRAATPASSTKCSLPARSNANSGSRTGTASRAASRPSMPSRAWRASSKR